MLNRKGILSFLLITFGITYGIEFILILNGVRFDPMTQTQAQLVVAALMWVPAFATLITMRFVTHEKASLLNVRFGLLKPYLQAAWLVPVLFILVYGLTWLLAWKNQTGT